MLPARSMISVVIARLRRSTGSRSAVGASHQSISPACSAAAAVAASGIVCHSIRSMAGTFGPAVKLGVPVGRGT